MYEYKNVYGHIEVYLNGVFQFSADNMIEALEETETISENTHNIKY